MTTDGIDEVAIARGVRDFKSVREARNWTHSVIRSAIAQYHIWQGMPKNAYLTFDALLEGISPNIEQAHADMWEHYREAGAPYGETEDGAWKWQVERYEAMDTERNQEKQPEGE